jgi:FtsH-binding integral membrane protein
MAFDINIRLVGIVSAIGVLLFVGYLLYDKNQILSILFLLVGLILIIAFVISEIYFKKQMYDAPWNYK